MRVTEHNGIRVSATLLLTRLVVAFIFLWHGLPKAVNPDAAAEKFVGFGLPSWLGPVTGAVEVVAALLLAAGVFHLAGAAALSIVIVGALVTVQIPNGFTAGLERDLLILAATLTLATLGPGRFALASRASRSSTAGQRADTSRVAASAPARN